MFPSPPDDGHTPQPTAVWRTYPDGLIRHHKAAYSTNPRASYFRSYKRNRKMRAEPKGRNDV